MIHGNHLLETKIAGATKFSKDIKSPEGGERGQVHSCDCSWIINISGQESLEN
jgi:hypothetical protein